MLRQVHIRFRPCRSRIWPVRLWPDPVPAFEGQTDAPTLRFGRLSFDVEVLAENLVHPWGMEVLPDGAILVTERAGTMR